MAIDKSGWTFGDAAVTGTIVRIVQERGFAFVRAGENEYFMHHSDFEGEFLSLKEKMLVTFTPTETPKGPRACNVSRDR